MQREADGERFDEGHRRYRGKQRGHDPFGCAQDKCIVSLAHPGSASTAEEGRLGPSLLLRKKGRLRTKMGAAGPSTELRVRLRPYKGKADVRRRWRHKVAAAKKRKMAT